MNNINEQFEAFVKLTNEELNKMWKEATNTAAKIVKDSVRQSIATNIPNSTKPIRGFGGKMTDAVGLKKTPTQVYIHARGTGKGGSFITKFFEDGSTTPRKTKDGKNRGSLTGYHFFKTGVDSSIDTARKELETQLEKTINAINSRTNG